jgi:hypothetical protein
MKNAPFAPLAAATLLLGLAASVPYAAFAANLTPYEAQYTITAGEGDRAPQIGTARQRLGDGCLRRVFERDVKVSLGLTQALRYDVNSSLRANEARSGRALDYKLDRVMNGESSARSGVVNLSASGGNALLKGGATPKNLELPRGTLLPQRMIESILEHLQKGETHFQVQAFDAEVVTNLVDLDVLRIAPDEVPLRPQDAAVASRIGGPSYPLALLFSRANGKPLFNARLLMHANGVISRLIASFGPFTVAANLTSYNPLPELRCAPPIRAD